MLVRRSARLLVPLVLGLALLQGCGGEEGPVDDGSQASVVDAPGLETAGVEVLAAAVPAAATGDQVAAALTDAGSSGATSSTPASVAADTYALDPGAVAGLLAVVADETGEAVVLVFDDPASAQVLAAEDPDVFAAAAVERRSEALLAGNLVGYAAGDAAIGHVRRALNSLRAG
ncbi:hypothetical protein [Nocardioides dongxiaopingii]|uniref:hypothetical protein n=1 Tax=Nocardioides dongxiaopingii TaxID=2576036 RepID=UPI0010C76AFC|nr:hypothetical protein [Nocardioides dongxiaopingii]